MSLTLTIAREFKNETTNQTIEVRRDVMKDGEPGGRFIAILRDFNTNIRYDECRYKNGKLVWSNYQDMTTGKFHGEQIMLNADGSYTKRDLNQKSAFDLLGL